MDRTKTMDLPALVVMVLTLLALTSSCRVDHVVRPEIRQLGLLPGGAMNLSLLVSETAAVSDARGRLVLRRYFPRTENIHTDLDSLKISTSQGRSLPWTQIEAGNLLVAVEFVLESSNAEVTIQFEWQVSVVSENSTTGGECQRIFSGAVYPLIGEECTGSLAVRFAKNERAAGRDCVTFFTSSVHEFNHTLNEGLADEVAHDPSRYQVSVKCYGGARCTCACKRGAAITDFCLNYLTAPSFLSLYPPGWGDDLFVGIIMIPMVLCVFIQIVCKFYDNSCTIFQKLQQVFKVFFFSSVFLMMFFMCVPPVHMDATARACTSVFESDGSYFFHLLFWSYFPYVITLLLVTGFVDNTDLVVVYNGKLSAFFVLYQLLSPLSHVWIFLYAYVVPLTDALLLTASIFAIFAMRLYMRNPFRGAAPVAES